MRKAGDDMAKLTEKQEKYVQELIKGKSQREAYRIAYPKCKAMDKTIDEKASKLFAMDKVRTRYNQINDRLIKEAEDECIVSAKEVLRELKRIGFADIKDFLSFRTGKKVVEYDDDGEPIIDYGQIIEVKNSDQVDGKVIQEVSINSRGVFTFKLHNKMDALEKLGKTLGMFKDKMEVSGEIKTNQSLSNEELDERIKELKSKLGFDASD